jgi:exopolyphosphatase/guanosine-5'-triphosphate,3'-diphosphate pyrophosphatase
VGASGTFETLYAIHSSSIGYPQDTEAPVEAELDLTAFRGILGQLLQKDRAGRLSMPGMLPMRVDMIVVASCLLEFVLRKYQLSEIRVSGYALKEGVLSQLLT